jgi:hypothetical protein
MPDLNPLHLYAAGTLSVGFGAWSYYTKKKRLETWISVVGVVDNIRRDRNGNVSATMKYMTKEGAKQLCTLPVSDGDSLGLGTELVVAYEPARPERAFIADRKDMNFGVISALVIGVALWLAATCALFAGNVFPEQWR